MQYAIAHLDPNEDNPSMEENPCINVDFENEEESCLEAATMMMDEGYKMVTPFFIEDGGKAGTFRADAPRISGISRAFPVYRL